MALIKCPECGNEVSDKAGNCPCCGFPIYLKVNEGFDKIRCHYCGTINENYQTKCSNCNAVLAKEEKHISEHSINRERDTKPIEVCHKAQPEKKKGNFKRILTIIFLFFYFPVGVIMMWVWNVFNKKTRTIITSVVVLLLFIYMLSDGNDNESSKEDALSKQPTIIVSKEEEQDVHNNIATEEIGMLLDGGEVYDGHGVIISTSDVSSNNLSTTIVFILENTSDKDYSVSAHTFSVNGLMCGGNKYGSDSSVPAGKKAKLSIDIDNAWLAENGMKDISEIDIIFWGYYDISKEWDSGIVKIKTNRFSEDGKYSVVVNELYSDEIVSIWILDKSDDKFTFAVKNASTYNASFEIDNCSVNGWAYDITDYTYDLYNVPIHCDSYDIFTIEIDDEFMKENNINKVENIEFNVILGDDYWNYQGVPWKHSTEKIYVSP